MDPTIQISNGTHQVILQITDPNTFWLVIGTFVLAVITLIGIIWSNKNTQRSNKLLQTDLYARVKPLLRIHNTGHEPINPMVDPNLVDYHPNLRNDGMTEASHLRINYKVMDREVDLEEIVRQENEIEKQSIPYDGSILPNGIAVLNAVNLPRTDKKISTVLWINFKFLDDVDYTIIFNIIFDGTGNYHRNTIVKHYTISDIKRVRKEMKIREEGAPIG
ncbi:MAG: hypothetical protein KGH76_04010 [Thaumarchaeota archaeon]|nr:hypothetical protein [Nitrososphaerota archaeon]